MIGMFLEERLLKSGLFWSLFRRGGFWPVESVSHVAPVPPDTVVATEMSGSLLSDCIE
jgi:hypothetical protein